MKNTPINNFLAVLLIYTMNIPIGSAQQVENSETSKIPKIDCRGKNTPNNNFSTIQPISTDSIPIDSRSTSVERGIIKHVSNLIPGE